MSLSRRDRLLLLVAFIFALWILSKSRLVRALLNAVFSAPFLLLAWITVVASWWILLHI